MLNKYLLFFICLFVCNIVEAQIGINTTSPYSGSVMHIRSDESTSGKYENDLIIDSKGYVGLGTPTPKANVDVIGTFRFAEKPSKDFSNNLLATDSEGNASWKNFNKRLRYKKITWNLENNNYPDITNGTNNITVDGTTEFSSTIADASSTDNSLTLPKGRYYTTISAGISNATSKYIYQIIRVLKDQDVVLESYYFNAISGCAIFLDLSDSSTITIQIEALDVRSDASKNLPIADALPLVGPNKVWAKVNVLSLDINT